MKRIYFLEEGSMRMRDLLGGKGANLAEMKKMGLPVPDGFTIITRVCIEYLKTKKWPEGLKDELREAMKKLEERTGKSFGDPENPLLVSVRSGAPVSMPGMMDTILNLGLNDASVEGLARMTNDRRFALDSYRRFIQMFGNVVKGIPHEDFDKVLEDIKKKESVRFDYEISPERMDEVVKKFKTIYRENTGEEFPQDPWVQLEMAIESVWNSWNNQRAITYRKMAGIPDDMGTAVNVIQMVFGNVGNDSGTGVLFTRNPSTGEKGLYGEFLINAQGEDVVAGIRTPESIGELAKKMPDVYKQLKEIAEKLEVHYRDMQDIEFTVEKGKLYILQTRNGKRTPQAAVKIAVDMVKEGLLSRKEAVMRVDPKYLDNLLHPSIDYSKDVKVIAVGLPASPGAASGKVVFDPDKAKELGDSGESVILVRPETTPDDIHGIIASKGVLTSRGGMTSHAAVVARGMGKPAVVGCDQIHVDLSKNVFFCGDLMVKEGDWITIDGSTGKVILGQAPILEPRISGELEELLSWADSFRKLSVRANADLAEDARKAREFGAEGIGLCRTEHMFLGPDRLPIVREMIMATTNEEKKKALNKLLERQRQDFIELLEAMDGLPVVIRLLDPPLHEFLPDATELEVELTRLKLSGGDKKRIKELEDLLAKVNDLKEANPMLGHRGCRLGITMPDIYKMQARAIAEAAITLKKMGRNPKPEIEIPLVAFKEELAFLKKEIVNELEMVYKERGERLNIRIGTMIELPRAALTAGELAKEAEFFSFGTNDLTQTTLGFSRDDVGRFMKRYLELGILNFDPFQTLDINGVGRLVEISIRESRKVKPDVEIGVCGEHGGDPRSIEFFHRIGLDYVSCSPYRIPVARLAAAQVAIKGSKPKGLGTTR